MQPSVAVAEPISEPINADCEWIQGKDVVAVPSLYLPEFLSDPRDRC
jgi:hypothetical protein